LVIIQNSRFPPPLLPIDPTQHSVNSNAGDFSVRSPGLCYRTLQNSRVWAGADDEIVSLASPDVLESQYGPISVPLTLPDGVHTFTGLGQGQNLLIISVRAQPERVVVGVEGAGGAGISRLRAGTEGGGEVESKVDSIADLLGGAGRQLEQVLVVREDVVEGRVGVIRGLTTNCGDKGQHPQTKISVHHQIKLATCERKFSIIYLLL